jgi:hypothetical protein
MEQTQVDANMVIKKYRERLSVANEMNILLEARIEGLELQLAEALLEHTHAPAPAQNGGKSSDEISLKKPSIVLPSPDA